MNPEPAGPLPGSGTVFATPSRMRTGVLLLCLLAVTGCDENSSNGPTPVLHERFTLAPGDVATVGAVDLRMQFIQVTGDSRCPADALCILGGDAIVRILAYDGGTATPHELHTGDMSRASVAHGRARITLVELQPYPFSSRAIRPEDYRATFVVETP
jgi:hypothetical protein